MSDTDEVRPVAEMSDDNLDIAVATARADVTHILLQLSEDKDGGVSARPDWRHKAVGALGHAQRRATLLGAERTRRNKAAAAAAHGAAQAAKAAAANALAAAQAAKAASREAALPTGPSKAERHRLHMEHRDVTRKGKAELFLLAAYTVLGQGQIADIWEYVRARNPDHPAIKEFEAGRHEIDGAGPSGGAPP